MARHAGFAVAVTLGEGYLNQTLWAAIADQEPISLSRLFQLPGSAPIAGGASARLSGVALFEGRPTMQMRANAGNTVAVTTSALVYVAANTNSAAPIDQDQTWKLRLTASVNVLVDVDVAPTGLFLRWQPSGSSINSITTTVLEGPGIPQFLVDAINSPATHAAMTAAVQAFGPMRISDRIFARRLEHIQPGKFASTNFSVFEWFVIRADISRVAVRVLDGTIALGIDFAGLSAGNDSALVDLRKQVGDGPVYRAPVSSWRPILIPSAAKQDDGDIDVLVNADVLTAIVRDVSRQIAGTPIAPNVKIVGVSLRPQFFDKPQRGRELGLCFEVTINHQLAGDVTGRIFLQPFLFTGGADSPGGQEAWRIYVGKTEVDVPWWVDVAVVLVGTALAAMFPLAAPLIAVGAVAAIDGIIPGAVSNAEATADAALKQGMTVAPGLRNGNLPTRLKQPTYTGTTRLKVSTDGVDIHMITVAPSVRFGEGDSTASIALVTTSLDGGSPAPYTFAVALRNELATLANDCTVQVIVERADTGAEVARSEGPYSTNRTVVLDHLNADIYLVDEYRVHARIYFNRLNMTGLLFATSAILKVPDMLDRRHPFVTWPRHTAHFRSPSNPAIFWHREATHTLHRTAVSARCLALRQRTERMANKPGLGVEYVDALGFDFSQVQAHRPEVCDFCFFGCPNGNRVFPQEDWFKR